MSKYGNGFDGEKARKEKEASKYARWAAEADATEKPRVKNPRVYRKGEQVGAKVGQLKGADLARLQAQLKGRFGK